jgi:hypothetical protein
MIPEAKGIETMWGNGGFVPGNPKIFEVPWQANIKPAMIRKLSKCSLKIYPGFVAF